MTRSKALPKHASQRADVSQQQLGLNETAFVKRDCMIQLSSWTEHDHSYKHKLTHTTVRLNNANIPGQTKPVVSTPLPCAYIITGDDHANIWRQLM